MPTPIHTPNGLAQLRRASNAGMGHTARRRLENRVRQPNGEYSEAPSWGSPVCCRLQPIGSKDAQIAAATGIEATWSFKAPDETEVAAQQVYEVVRRCRTHVVRITGPLHEHGEVLNLWAAVDTELDKA